MSLYVDYDNVSKIKGHFEGGWCFIETAGGAQVELPVTLPPIGVGVAISGSDTYLMRVEVLRSTRYARKFIETQVADTVRAIFSCSGGVHFDQVGPLSPPLTRELYKMTAEIETLGGDLMIQPDNSHKIRRVNLDYRMGMFRTGMPKVTGMHMHSETVDGVTSSTPTETELYPSQSNFWGVVPYGGHAMEDTLQKHTYAKCDASHTKSDAISYVLAYPSSGAMVCPPAWAPHMTCPPGETGGAWACAAQWPSVPSNTSRSSTDTWIFPYYVQPYTGVGSNPQMAGYMMHDVPWVRYLNTWAHPLWSFFTGWNNWDLQGSPVLHQLYWQPERSQWFGDHFLPPSERTNTRNHIALDCLWQESGMSPFWDAFTAGLGWVGCSRWQTRKVTALGNFQYGSGQAGLWSAEHCSIAHGASMTVTIDAGQNKGKIRLKLGDWNIAPFQWANLANEALLDWSLFNIKHVWARFIGLDGAGSDVLKVTSADIDTTRGHIYRRPAQFTDRPAGSWAIDNGGLVLADAGVDPPGVGLSATVMGDPERIAAFGLNKGRTAIYLELEIEPLNPDFPVTISYPKLFLASQADPKMIRESGHASAIIQQNGTGIRNGNQSFSVGNTLLGTPNIFGQGEMTTIIDALCWSRSYVQGVQHLSGVTTELTSLYDSYEGQSVAQVAANGQSVLLPAFAGGWRFALVNTIAEVPPLQCFPHHDRDVNFDQVAGFTNDIWSYAQGPIYLVYNASARMFIRNRGGATITTAQTTLPGWKLERGDPHVTNSERNPAGAFWEYEIVEGAIVRGRARPWRGYFAIGGPGTGVYAKWVAYHVSPFQRHLVVIIDLDDTVRFAFCDNAPKPLDPLFKVSPIKDAAAIAVHFDSSDQETPFLWVVSKSGSLNRYESVDEATWTNMLVISPSKAVDVAAFVDPQGIQHTYWSTNDKTLLGELRDRSGTVLSTFTIVGADVKGPLDHFASFGDDSQTWTIILWYVRESDSALVQLNSPDGVNFT